ncbi:D-alanyl-D-alanine carboxypeptidase family protein [Nakamurella lactea]|uniref:D-alanyl-D-alanine carboxypeptidase family protein n=1 Tax=Nakamurella lactea TaxID=459515 RepID=UPI000404460C|nr:D-alanyl-D-alanine carboxypeptidase family protein [Nakamurella lactea]
MILSDPYPRSRRRRRSAAGSLLVCLALLAAPVVGTVPFPGGPFGVSPAAADEDPSVLPPSETVSTPNTDDCSQQTLPPAADDTSEAVPSGRTSPAPLPVPTRTVGGARLAECGFAMPKGAPALPPDISAAAWLIADMDTGDVLAAKDAHGRYRPASTLKLLTMNVLLRNLKDLNKVVVGTQQDADQEGSRVGIGPGGRYTVKQLMQFLMMGSGNDVAFALARANGGYDKTVKDMNARAKALGAFDTRAATVSGLDGPGQMTSAYDLALIARSDMEQSAFPGIISTKYSTVPGFGDYAEFGIANENQLLFGYPGALGGKTGYTDAAGNTYVGMAEKDGRRLVVTMLAGTQHPRRQWMQAASLLDWGFALPDGATPVGRLVASAAEATGIAQTPSVPPASTRSTLTLGTSRSSGAAVPTTGSMATGAGSSAATESAAADTSGTNIAVWIGIVLVVLLAAVAVLMGLRGSGRRTPAHAAGARQAAPPGPTDPPAPTNPPAPADPPPPTDPPAPAG